MAPILYPPSLLSADQVLQHAYDDATQTLRTTATAIIVGQPIEVEINMFDDSVRLGDGTDFFTSTTIGSKVGLDVNVINPLSAILTNDTNYGVVGANTIRTAAQIGNATGAADFNSGLTTAQTLRVVLPTDQTAIPISGTIAATQSGVWTTGRTWTLISGTDSVTSFQGTSPWVISGTVSISNLPITLDTDYGVVGASTLRTASQIGNSTGAANFNAGVTTTQTLRVVLPTDQTPIPAAQAGVWTVQQGTPPWIVSGTVAATQSGTWSVLTPSFPTTVDTNYGVVGASTLRTASEIGNVTGAADFNTGITTAQTLRVVLPTDQTPIPVIGTITTSPDVNIHDAAGNNLTSQVNGGQRALDVGIDVAGVQIDPRAIRALTSADVVTANQGTSPWVVSGTIAATQSGAWTTGRTWTLSSGIDSVASMQSGIWTVQPGNTANTTPWLVTDSSNGPVTPGTVATNSSLAGGQFNTILPTLTNTQQAALQIDSSGRLIISPLSGTSTVTLSEDHNYGVVGANTLRTGAQIGNATGAALFGAGTTTAQVLRVVLPTDQTAIPVTQSTSPWVISGTVAATQSGAWTTGRTWTLASGTDSIATVQSGSWTVTANAGTNLNTSALALDTSVNGILRTQGSTTAGETGPLVQGATTTAAPTYTTGQTNPLSLTTAGSLRVDASGSTQPISGTVTISNLPTIVDTNYGAVGASTIRTASQIGNATGTALFGAGTTTAQVLRVVLPTDQTAIPVTQSTSPWVISGTITATQSGTWTVQQGTPPWSVVGAAASGAAKSGNPVQIGSVFNTTQPTVTNGQAVESQATARGGLIVATGVDAFNITNITGTVSLPTGASTSSLQTTGNTSLSTIATNTASLILAQGSTTSGQTGPLMQGAVTTAAPTYTTAQTSPLSLTTTGALRVDASGTSLSATVNQGTANTVANAWPTKITDGTDTAAVTANSDLKVSDGLRNGGVYSQLSVPTANTPVEAKVGAARLTNRKCLVITPNNAGMFWGLDGSVTTTTGQPLSNGQSITFNIDPDSTFAVFLVGSTNNKTANITEMP